jgi:hypothetical protein
MPTTTEETAVEVCERCGHESEEFLNVSVNGCEQVWCETCRETYSFTCADCEDILIRSDAFGYIASGELVCELCGDENFTCDDCGDRYANTDYARDGYCCHCVANYEDDILSDDGGKPRLTPWGEGKQFYGVELEVELRDSDDLETEVSQVRSQLGEYAICKGDGSLDNGFEICTSPASLDFHREKLWTKFFSTRHGGLRIMDSCGLHVHASRAPLSELTIAKIVCFANARRNALFMTIIAGRSASTYAKYKEKHIKTAAKKSGDRYEAVNLQPEKTIEFRLFKSTTKQPNLFKALEFCDALIKFCSPAGRSITDCLSRTKFCAYVKTHKRSYPHLHAFIAASWLGQNNKAAVEYGFAKRES